MNSVVGVAVSTAVGVAVGVGGLGMEVGTGAGEGVPVSRATAVAVTTGVGADSCPDVTSGTQELPKITRRAQITASSARKRDRNTRCPVIKDSSNASRQG